MNKLLTALLLVGCTSDNSSYIDMGNTDQNNVINNSDLGTNDDQKALDDLLLNNSDLSNPDLSPYCYRNNFDDINSLNNLLIQNGDWSFNNDKYLDQTQVAGGWRISYENINNLNDFDAEIDIRMPSGPFGAQQHTALLFRYEQNSPLGTYDQSIDHGYALEIEKGDGTNFNLTLEDVNVSRLKSAQVLGNYGEWHKLGVKTRGNNIECYYDGLNIFSLQDNLYSKGKIGYGSHASISNYRNLNVCQK